MFESGHYFIGCNYWASHAGTRMWVDWDPAVVEADFARLAAHRLTVLRVFPLWNDFQPLRMHRGGGGSERELRMREDPLPHTEAGRAGVDETMAERFGVLCDLADKYGLRLVVGLITGWMSGRMHAPEAFLDRALLTDPLVVGWQVRFVRYMVHSFRDKPAIAAWDLGNECNCLGSVDRAGAFLWETTITNAIKREDSTRPVVSGMHGLNPQSTWTPQEQGEALDILCTHPYPLFTPHCATDPLYEMKSILHATAESLYYGDLSGKPCFIEEAGTLGPMIANEEISADYVRCSLISTWAHDLRGFLWWCANEQTHLTHTPYDWDAVERELGIFRLDGSPKPVGLAFKDFAEQLDALSDLGLSTLPPRLTDAVCILTAGQDSWATAYGTFLIAKKAGLDITFAWHADELPQSPVYLLPSLSGTASITRHAMTELLRRVREDGATLYLSLNDALLSPMDYTGLRTRVRSGRVAADTVSFGGTDFSFWTSVRMPLENIDAAILATDQEGCPAFTAHSYGKGQVYFLAYPIETIAACNTGVISGANPTPYEKFYEALPLKHPAKRLSRHGDDAPFVGLTEHPTADGRIGVLINYTPIPRTVTLDTDGLPLTARHFFTEGTVTEDGDALRVTLPANTGCVLVFGK